MWEHYNENKLLKVANGYTHLEGQYTYSNDGKLISSIDQLGNQYTYDYDNNGRIKKQNEVGTDNYIELFYEDNKVITHRYYEFGSSNGVPNSNLEKRELQIDGEGRIVKMVDLEPDQSAINTLYEIYEYDDNGNIIKVTSKNENEENESVRNYSYENIKNPYYYSFKKYY